MTERPPNPDCNLLWARSGLICAHPDCDRQLVAWDKYKWVTIGEIAHIYGSADAPGSARHDPALTKAETDSYKNCLILCRRHHRIIDDAWQNYPPSMLFEWKEKHESRYLGFSAAIDPSVSHSHLPPKARRYVARPDVLAEISRHIQVESKVVLSGVSGSGKTQEALSYFHESTTAYTFRWWVRSHDEITTLTDLAGIGLYIGLAQEEGEPLDDYVGRVLARLEGVSGWLIVFDNAADSSIVRYFPASGGHIVATTQASAWSRARNLYRIPKLTVEQASAILAEVVEGLPAGTVDEIYQATVGHPLAIDQAASFIANTGMPVRNYVELLRSERPELLSRGSSNADSFSASILATVAKVDQSAFGLLKTISFIASTAIPLVSPPNSAPFESYVPKSKLAIEDCIAALRSYSLLEREENLISVHELVQDVVRSSLCGSDRRQSLMSATLLLTEQLPERTTDVAEWQLVELLMPHCVVIAKHLSAEPGLHPAGAAHFYNKLAPYLTQKGQRADAETMLRSALDLLSGYDDTAAETSRASLLHNLARTISNLDGGDEAASLYEQSLAIKLKVYGPDHLMTAISYGALGTLRELQGSYAEAEELYEKSRRIYEREHDQRRLIESIADLSRVRFKMRDLPGALMLAEGAVSKATGSQDWNEVVDAHLMLATIHRDSGNFVGAAKILRAGQKIAKESDLVSSNLARTLFMRGEVLADLGVTDTAGVLLSEGLYMMERLAAEPTAEIAAWKINYGLFLLGQGLPVFAVRDLFAEARENATGLLVKEIELEKSARELQAHCETLMGNEEEASRLLDDGDSTPAHERFFAHFGFEFRREGNRLIMYARVAPPA